MWTKDGRNRYPELAYSEGQVLFEQITLIKALSVLLIAPGGDALEGLINGNEDFRVYRDVDKFISSGGAVQPDSLDPVSCSYVRLFKGFKLSDDDKAKINRLARQAFDEVRAGQLTGSAADRHRTLGLYNYIRDTAWTFDKWAGWYTMVRDDWAFFSGLRVKLRNDFDRLGIKAEGKRQAAVEKMLTDRLEFRQAVFP